MHFAEPNRGFWKNNSNQVSNKKFQVFTLKWVIHNCCGSYTRRVSTDVSQNSLMVRVFLKPAEGQNWKFRDFDRYMRVFLKVSIILWRYQSVSKPAVHSPSKISIYIKTWYKQQQFICSFQKQMNPEFAIIDWTESKFQHLNPEFAWLLSDE